MDIDKFHGNIMKWGEFIAKFDSIIGNNDAFTDLHKFLYLKKYLTGDAARLIEALDCVEGSYRAGRELLHTRYDRKRMVILTHIKALNNLPYETKQSKRHLTYLVDQVNNHLRALSTCGVSISNSCPFTYYIILSRLDPITRTQWENHNRSNDNINVIIY